MCRTTVNVTGDLVIAVLVAGPAARYSRSIALE
jgi:Na+/H+-dicarboxylate symporter